MRFGGEMEMIRIVNRRGLIILTIALCFAVAMLALVPLVNCPPEYDPWYDINDDGKIDLKDVYGVSKRFGATGTPLTKASIENDSGWINIADKCGQYFNVTHNLNSTDLIVDIQGRTTPDSGPHQKHYALTTHIPGWSRTYGGASDDVAYSAAQTSDGGYAVLGTQHVGYGDWDTLLFKTYANGTQQWNMIDRSIDRQEDQASAS
jgi:hypothetical protein